LSQPADILWNEANFLWNDNQYIWGLLEEILNYGGLGFDEWDKKRLKKLSQLNEQTKHKIVSLYVEIFRDHLDTNVRELTERAGIKFTHFNKKEINKLISVKTINSSLENVIEVKANLTGIETKLLPENINNTVEVKANLTELTTQFSPNVSEVRDNIIVEVKMNEAEVKTELQPKLKIETLFKILDIKID